MQQNTKVKYLNKTSVIILIIFLVVCQLGCSVQKETDSSLNQNLTKAQVQEDRDQVIEYLENIHPFFCWKRIKKNIKLRKKNICKQQKKQCR